MLTPGRPEEEAGAPGQARDRRAQAQEREDVRGEWASNGVILVTFFLKEKTFNKNIFVSFSRLLSLPFTPCIETRGAPELWRGSRQGGEDRHPAGAGGGGRGGPGGPGGPGGVGGIRW